MEVKGLTCGKCESELVFAEIGENSVGVSQCPICHGKIKSPMCCGKDMASSS
jgi:hypothetical protein